MSPALAILFLVFLAVAVASLFVRALKPCGFAFWVLAASALAALRPAWFTAWGGFDLRKTIGPLVQVTLFGMGMTLTFGDFRRVLRMPKAIGLGMVLQFSILPLGALLFVKLFGLSGPVAAGLILIGSVSGGTASNVVTYLARANVPLSIAMTACSTMLAPFATPFLMKILAGAYVQVSPWEMMRSILFMVIAPLLAGLCLHRWLPAAARALTRILPAVAMLAICVIVGITIASSRAELLRVGPALLAGAVCLNLTGLALGYIGARLCGFGGADARTISIEVGMQNGGMATGIAFNVLREPLAALGSAVFGPFSAVSTSLLASWWRKKADTGKNEKTTGAGDGDDE
jgi:BASS family bile acid:Na+ symporter